MATPKVWTAYDLELGILKINRVIVGDGNQAIHFEQRYGYVDDLGDVLREVAGSRISDTVELAEMPTDIMTALGTINNWLYARCLEKEGMS